MSASDEVRILYVRHGESQAEVTRTLAHSRADHPLSERGREQAEALAHGLRERGWTFHGEVRSSPMLRATETAKILAGALSLSVTPDERLREIDVGSLDGRFDDEAWEAYAEMQRRWASGEASRRFPDGENYRTLLQRLRSGLLDAAAGPGSSPGYGYGDVPSVVITVGHGGGLRCVLPQLISNVAEAYPYQDMGTGSVCLLAARPVVRPTGLRLDAWDVPATELDRLEPRERRRW